MTDEAILRSLFDRWERVWHEARYELAPSCLCELYIRHDDNGDRILPREEYAAELKQVHLARPGIRVLVYDHSFGVDRAWFRFAFQWIDPKSGEPQSRAGMQLYRIEDGRLAETWIAMHALGSTWTGRPQERWTSPPR